MAIEYMDTVRRGLRVRKATIKALPGAQQDFINDWSPFVAFFSGFGGGKTWAGAAKGLYASCRRYHGFDGLAVAPTYSDIETVIVPALTARFAEVGIVLHYHGGYPHHLWFMLGRGAKRRKIVIHLRSGQRPDLIHGFECAWAWIDEAARIVQSNVPTKDLKTQIIGRLRGKGLDKRGGPCLFCTGTHEGELSWVAQDFITKPKPGHVYYQGSTRDNHFIGDFADRLCEQYDSRLVEQYVHGQPVTIAGQRVYYSFSPDLWPAGNVDASIEAGEKRPLLLTLDFNAAPGMHGLVCQERRELDEIWVLDELHRPGLTVPSLVRDFAKRYGEYQVAVRVFGDATGRGRDTAIGATAYEHVQQAMMDNGLHAGLSVPKSNPLTEDRYISMNGAFEDGKGRHVRIHPRCKVLLRDLRTVQRNERGQVDKTQPALTHASDALGYLVHRLRPVRRVQIADFTFRKG